MPAAPPARLRSLLSPLAGVGMGALAAFLLSPQHPPPKQPNDFFHLQRAWPAAEIPAGAFANALAQARTLQAARSRFTAQIPWLAAGPTNVGGRITAIAVDPSDPHRVYVGAADGGVLRSTDGGGQWQPLLDSFGSLSIGALAHHPSQPGILLAGTGEANASGDSYDGIGILRTTDGGDTWTLVGLPSSQRIGRIAFDPTNPQVVHAAVAGGLFSKSTERGMYRSTDGGLTWQRTLFVSDSTSAIDVVVDPSNGNNVYAAMWERLRGPDFRNVSGLTSGIWKSTDSGLTWAEMTNGVPKGTDVARIGLAIASSNPLVLYAVYSKYSAYSGTVLDGVYKTTDAGATWTQANNATLGNPVSSFGWYFGNIRVNPADENEVWVLGVSLRRSGNGGLGWSDRTGSQHVDMHALWIDPANPNHLISGNDGGIFTSTDGGATWAKSPKLPITQFYAVTVDPQLPWRIYGGTQDNSTPRTLTGALDDWDILIGGDGFTVIVDPTDSNIIYGEYQFGGLVKSTNGGASFTNATSGVNSGDRVNWHMPYVMDPNDHLTLYLGTHRVYRSTDGAASWNPISPDLTSGPGAGNLTFGTLSTLAVARSASNTLYTGSDDGNVFVTTDGGTSWTEISAALPLRYVTRVAIDPFDDAVAYVALSGYRIDEFLPHVFRTTDHGTSWTDISGNLPEAPVNDLVVDPLDTNRLFAATDVGVYLTTDLGATWESAGAGLPLSVIVDLELHVPTRTLVAGTHGRSTFKLDLGNAVDAPVVAGVDQDAPRLSPPRPNPSRGDVALSFWVPRAGRLRLTIHDVAGRLVRKIREGPAEPGAQEVFWDGRDSRGRLVAAGVYFARLETQGVRRVVKISRLR